MWYTLPIRKGRFTMKRIFALLLALYMMCGTLAGCGEEPAESVQPNMKEVQLFNEYGVSCDIPSDWEKKVNGSLYYYYPTVEEGLTFLMIGYSGINQSIFYENNQQSFYEGLQKNVLDSKCVENQRKENKQGIPYASIIMTGTLENTTGKFYNAVFDADDGLVNVALFQSQDCDKDFEQAFYMIVDTVSVELETETTTTETTTAATTEVVTESTAPTTVATMGQKNALAQAKQYLSFMAFSYSGLIEQLEYEGYSTDEATYGADNCGADWDEQAAKKAQDYIDITAFSRSGLIDQLIYEGFTQEQAEYGVTAVGY